MITRMVLVLGCLCFSQSPTSYHDNIVFLVVVVWCMYIIKYMYNLNNHAWGRRGRRVTWHGKERQRKWVREKERDIQDLISRERERGRSCVGCEGDRERNGDGMWVNSDFVTDTMRKRLSFPALLDDQMLPKLNPVITLLFLTSIVIMITFLLYILGFWSQPSNKWEKEASTVSVSDKGKEKKRAFER